MLADDLPYQRDAVERALDPKRLRLRLPIADAVGLEGMGEDEHASPRIGILTRTKTQRDSLVRALEERGLRVQNIDRGGYLNGAPAVMTLHRSKGTEFERVILFGIDDQHVPYAVRGYHFDTDGHNEAMLCERSLLYVGATRARERLLVTWTKQRSAYLPR